MQTTIKLTDDVTLCATWEGGAYIEVGVTFGHPVEVINVWDYQKGERRIPFTREAMRAAIFTWVSDYGRADLLHDISEHWGFY